MTDTSEDNHQPLQDHLTPINPEDTMAEAGRKALLKDFIQYGAYEVMLPDNDDVETIHKMRVTTRRMRSVFNLLGDYYKSKATKPFTAHLKVLGKRLGAVRDIDVMMVNLQEYQQNHATDSAFESQLARLQGKREKAVKRLSKFLKTEEHTNFTERFTKFLTHEGKGVRKIPTHTTTPYQVRHVLPIIVQEHLVTIKAYDNVLNDPDVDTLHGLRIEFKQMRYLITHFQDVLGTSSSSFTDDLVHIQDYLGELNDSVVAHAYFSALAKGKKLAADQKETLSAYLETLADDRQDAIENFSKVWDKFNTRTVQRRLMDALLVLR